MPDVFARSPKPLKGISAQLYKDHVSEVMRLAENNAEKVSAYSPYGLLLRNVVKNASTYHDLGKLDGENQAVLKNANKKHLPIPHWDAGTAHLLNYSQQLVNQIAAYMVTCHHRGLLSLPEEQVKGNGMFREPSAKEKTKTFLSEYLRIHEMEVGSSNIAENNWNGKNATPLFMRMALSCLVDADHTDSAYHCREMVPEGVVLLESGKRLEALDHYIESLKTDDKSKIDRNQLRQEVYEACRKAQPAETGIIACDSPVGTGKTTAVMAHLLNVARQKDLRRVFVVLPFTNIIDQSVSVYRKALVLEGENPEKAVSAHHHKADFEAEESRVFSFLWNSPITVTTAVQFFETLSSNHPATLRKLHNLAGSAIFIDEAHASLPAHLWPQAWKWLKELVADWGCYVVMASGSLTRFWALPEFSLPIDNIPELIDLSVRERTIMGEKQRINYKIKEKPMNLKDLCEWILTLPAPRLLILNTVQSAAAVARELEKKVGREKVEHLSTSLAPIHRNMTINRVKSRLNNKNDNDWTLVATSCVEAGVDFSFKTAARELCSLVSTIQTAGRSNRSGEYGTSDLWGFKIQSCEQLKEHPAFKISSRILANLYKEEKISPEFCSEAMRREIREKNQGRVEDDPIVQDEKRRKFPDVAEKFRIISSNMVTVIIDDDLVTKIENYEHIDYRELQQKTVSIYSTKVLTYGLSPIRDFEGMYKWNLKYDDFIGYMAGVLTVSDFINSSGIV